MKHSVPSLLRDRKPRLPFRRKQLSGLLFSSPLIALFALGISCRPSGQAPGPETDSAAAEAIQSILIADEQLADRRNHASEDTALSTAIRQYIAGIDSLDFSGCPTGFTAAFQRHRDAWAASIGFFSQFDDRRGEMHELFTAIEAEGGQQQADYEEALRPIMATWLPVDSLARRYGALPEAKAE